MIYKILRRTLNSLIPGYYVLVTPRGNAQYFEGLGDALDYAAWHAAISGVSLNVEVS
jgi:hypothetical protein